MATQQQTGPWREAVEDNAPMVEEDGDVFAPLKKIRQQYYDRANRIVAKHTTDEGIDADYVALANEVRDCGDRVGLLIPIGAQCEEANAEPTTSSISPA